MFEPSAERIPIVGMIAEFLFFFGLIVFKYDFFFPFKVKAEFAFTRLCRVLFYKMALFEVTELLCVRVFVDMLSRFETYRRTRHRTWIQVARSMWSLKGG